MNTCQWFYKCNEEATKQVEHPTLGWLDCCDKHIEWLGENPSPTQFVPPIVANRLAQNPALARLMTGTSNEDVLG